MACRRGVSSLGAVLSSFSRLALQPCALQPAGVQQLATLTSLQPLLAGQTAAGTAAGPLRPYSAAAAGGEAAAAAAAAAGPGPTESLEQVRARIFGTHIGG